VAAHADLEQAQLEKELDSFAFRLLALPVSVPASLWKGRKRRRQMATFAQEQIGRGILDHNQIALEWVNGHPREYPFGQYGKGFAKVKEAFRKMVEPGRG
jgi:hypothetical protein